LTSQNQAQIDVLEPWASSVSLKIGLEAMNLPVLGLFSYAYRAAGQQNIAVEAIKVVVPFLIWVSVGDEQSGDWRGHQGSVESLNPEPR
jgi:hypothetical protein